MGALSAAVLENASNAAFDYFDKNKLYNQHVQDKPLLKALKAKQKAFPGGKEDIVCNPVFETQSNLEGFEGDDTVTFTNPTPIKEVRYPWKMQHLGIKMTTQELLKNGITVDETNGDRTSSTAKADIIRIQDVLQAKMEDASEGYADGMNTMLWQDGTQSTKDVPGIQYLIAEDPTSGVVGGIDRGLQPLWRNVALTTANGGTQITPSTANSTLIRTLQKQVRQLRRYGKPDLLILAGSDFMDALEDEVYAKGDLTQSGFGEKTEAGVSEYISIRGLGTFMYDPTLDDLSKEKFAYFIDMKSIQLRPIDGEDMKQHTPRRPHDKFVIYKSWTWAGGLSMKQANTSMVAEIA